jgi:hypothetical protein
VAGTLLVIVPGALALAMSSDGPTATSGLAVDAILAASAAVWVHSLTTGSEKPQT